MRKPKIATIMMFREGLGWNYATYKRKQATIQGFKCSPSPACLKCTAEHTKWRLQYDAERREAVPYSREEWD
jgi:hypothetical protein